MKNEGLDRKDSGKVRNSETKEKGGRGEKDGGRRRRRFWDEGGDANNL